MKKIFTLGLVLFTGLASFAFAPNRLTVAAVNMNNVKVTVDENTVNQQVGTGNAIFENLAPGYHTVRIYTVNNRWNYGRRSDDDRLLYSAAVNIKPMYEMSIVLKSGQAAIDERPLYRNNGNGNWGDNDNRIDNSRHGHGDRYVRMMSTEQFFAAKRAIANESFDNTKLTIAKQIADDYLMSTQQVKEMLQLFTFDKGKLDFAKYAYSKTTDKSNYFMVYDVFTFSSSKQQLADYIRNCR